ncbi:hypothetical protein UPYG_G00345760 [Umbra pygmaea]|uniref:Death domain-containing protein n=1 Tax=Umbra pygmaea TaxID=75934 RepID=A0ABD0VXK2_UMBPY
MTCHSSESTDTIENGRRTETESRVVDSDENRIARAMKDLKNTDDEWNIPEATLQVVPTDRQLARLASCLGSDWESVLLDLGLSTGALYRCRVDHPLSSHGQVLAGLVQWRQSQGKRATIHRLLQSLQATDIHPSTVKEVFL